MFFVLSASVLFLDYLIFSTILDYLNNIELSFQGEEGPQREQWSNPIEFLLSCVAMSVGLGNIWRFPFVAYNNGGGAFLIPYILVLFFIGKPLYYMELCLGQFASSGSVRVWDLCPAFRGEILVKYCSKELIHLRVIQEICIYFQP